MICSPALLLNASNCSKVCRKGRYSPADSYNRLCQRSQHLTDIWENSNKQDVLCRMLRLAGAVWGWMPCSRAVCKGRGAASLFDCLVQVSKADIVLMISKIRETQRLSNLYVAFDQELSKQQLINFMWCNSKLQRDPEGHFFSSILTEAPHQRKPQLTKVLWKLLWMMAAMSAAFEVSQLQHQTPVTQRCDWIWALVITHYICKCKQQPKLLVKYKKLQLCL